MLWFLCWQITRCTKRALWSQRNGGDKAAPAFSYRCLSLDSNPIKEPRCFSFLGGLFPNAAIASPVFPALRIVPSEHAHCWLLTPRQTSGSINTANPLHHSRLCTAVGSFLKVNKKTRERTESRMKLPLRNACSARMETWHILACWMQIYNITVSNFLVHRQMNNGSLTILSMDNILPRKMIDTIISVNKGSIQLGPLMAVVIVTMQKRKSGGIFTELQNYHREALEVDWWVKKMLTFKNSSLNRPLLSLVHGVKRSSTRPQPWGQWRKFRWRRT